MDRLWENARYFKAEMKRLGFDTGLSSTPITPVMLGEAPLAQQFSRELFENGVFAMAIGFPTVPRGKARIRVMISAAHQKDDLDQGLEAFAQSRAQAGRDYQYLEKKPPANAGDFFGLTIVSHIIKFRLKWDRSSRVRAGPQAAGAPVQVAVQA